MRVPHIMFLSQGEFSVTWMRYETKMPCNWWEKKENMPFALESMNRLPSSERTMKTQPTTKTINEKSWKLVLLCTRSLWLLLVNGNCLSIAQRKCNTKRTKNIHEMRWSSINFSRTQASIRFSLSQQAHGVDVTAASRRWKIAFYVSRMQTVHRRLSPMPLHPLNLLK